MEAFCFASCELMKICQPHWDRLRKALDVRGIGHLGAKSSGEAMRNVVTELEGREAENDFDPMMACNNMIWSAGMRDIGLSIMANNEDGSEKCPICERAKMTEEAWIAGPADEALKIAKEKGLVP